MYTHYSTIHIPCCRRLCTMFPKQLQNCDILQQLFHLHILFNFLRINFAEVRKILFFHLLFTWSFAEKMMLLHLQESRELYSWSVLFPFRNFFRMLLWALQLLSPNIVMREIYLLGAKIMEIYLMVTSLSTLSVISIHFIMLFDQVLGLSSFSC